MSKTIYVYADFSFFSKPQLIGYLYVDVLRGKEVFSFEYSKTWLSSQKYDLFDPDLYLFQGRQYPPEEKKLFGVFFDSCPDRWGRMLLQRRENILSKETNRKQRVLTETDYLLGIQDISRMGAIRFKTDTEASFLASEEISVPPWTTIRELENASLLFEKNLFEENKEKYYLGILLQPGSSLGGARPKANVQSPDGSMWIAKFPSKNDSIDTGAWEMTVHELALLCGLNVPPAKCIRFSNNGSTFLVKRFDRTPDNRRIHFISAMTILGKTDGANAADGSNYLDILGVIRQKGSKAIEDAQELWKRIVFNIAVSNTDDHLRNHGFVYDSKGLRLSPLYDVNPNPEGVSLSLNINETDSSLDFDIIMDIAPFFGIKKDEGAEILKNIKDNVSRYKYIASKFGISQNEIRSMECAFRY